MKALLVGDSQDLRENIPFCLRLRWPDAVILNVATGAEAVDAVEADGPHLLLADFALPDIPCVELVNKVRAFSDIPLVALVGPAITDMERARVLEAGADDYVLTPCTGVDILAKLRAILRRTSGEGFGQTEAPRTWGDLTVNFSTREVSVGGQQVKLTLHEFNLLTFLAKNQGRVLTHAVLLDRVWGSEYAESEDIVKKYVYRLRQKLDDNPVKPRFILTERGVGYRFAGAA